MTKGQTFCPVAQGEADIMESKPTKVTLDATVRRGFGRDAHYTASIHGLVNASAPTMAEAKAKLAENAYLVIANATMRPAFATDDDGSLIVAIPEGNGCAVYRVKDGSARCVSYAEGSPVDCLARVPHFTPVTSS